ncbi:MAG: DNA repair protein RecO [bacterium]
MELKTEGIVLKSYRSGEKDDLTYIFTRDLGKVMVTSKGTRKSTSKLKPVLELFSINNYQLLKSKKDSRYFTLINAEPVQMFQNMRLSLRKIGFCYLVVELLNKFTEIEDPDDELYDASRQLLDMVEADNFLNIENIESYFKLMILKYAGYDIAKDTQYLKDSNISIELTELCGKIQSSPDASKLNLELTVINDINFAVDAYIIYTLGEDVFSTKFIDGLRHDQNK